MTSKLQLLSKAGVITPPRDTSDVQYETIMGSVAYGVSDDSSDIDIYGFCIPPKSVIFPHLYGHIHGFGPKPQAFDQYQQHHIRHNNKTYDLTIFNIVKYFSLCMENNPNVIDSLYTPRNCVVHCTAIGNMVRDNRDIFLHKGSKFKFSGYAFSQLHKMNNKNPEGRRKDTVDKYGYDVKFAYHVVRLLYEAEMILEEGTIDLQRHSDHLKAIRRGEVSESDIREWSAQKELHINKLYDSSTLRHKPDVEAIKQLLLNCLEHHFGSLEGAYFDPNESVNLLRRVYAILHSESGKFMDSRATESDIGQ